MMRTLGSTGGLLEATPDADDTLTFGDVEILHKDSQNICVVKGGWRNQDLTESSEVSIDQLPALCRTNGTKYVARVGFKI